jgi:hypothetical protein
MGSSLVGFVSGIGLLVVDVVVEEVVEEVDWESSVDWLFSDLEVIVVSVLLNERLSALFLNGILKPTNDSFVSLFIKLLVQLAILSIINW